jgi:hypothetical protein
MRRDEPRKGETATEPHATNIVVGRTSGNLAR